MEKSNNYIQTIIKYEEATKYMTGLEKMTRCMEQGSWIWTVLDRDYYLKASDFYERNNSLKDMAIDMIEYIESVSVYGFETLMEAFMELLEEHAIEDAFENVLTVALEEDY